jgi:hypothetical protein
VKKNVVKTPLLLGLFSLAVVACGKGGDGADAAAAAEKKAHETAIADLKQPIGVISAYQPYAKYPEEKEKYFTKRRGDIEKSTLAAANEMRYAANKARQTLETSSAAATKDVQAALRTVTTACADAAEKEMIDKCGVAVTALDGALEKATTAAAALGVTGKYPRIAADSVTEEAKKGIANFLKAKGPGAGDGQFAQKRNDPAASVQDVMTACQAAASDASDAASTYEKAEESIRLIAVMRKMAADAQCHQIEQMESLRKDLTDCRKKAKSTECKIVCGKAKNAVDDGFPAAAFASMATDFADICEKK